jgi:hypothetical protein
VKIPADVVESARREHLPTFTHFLDLPILIVIVALGAMRPNTWALFLVGTILTIVAATGLALTIPRMHPFQVRQGGRVRDSASPRRMRCDVAQSLCEQSR